jgi:cell division protein ZapE
MGGGVRGYGTFGDGEGKPVRSPSEIYEFLVSRERITRDDQQLPIVTQLDALHHQLHSSDGGDAMTRGFYIHGLPGCGKTFLMDLMFRCAPMQRKRRTHFNSFMLREVHNALHKIRQEHKDRDFDGLPILAARIAQSTSFLCFDEFQVTDVADAMILRRLMALLWEGGVVMVLTSNRAPDELYKNGIQRESFLPFLDDLRARSHVVGLESGVDYRTAGTNLADTYFIGEGASGREGFEQAFAKVTEGATGEEKRIEVLAGRSLNVPVSVGGTARFTFQQICGSAVSAADYQALLEHYDTVFVEGVPMLGAQDVNAVRRFILLVDELYQAKLRVVLQAAKAPNLLFDKSSVAGDEAFAWDRCVSRLTEMGSKGYLDAARGARAKLDRA